MISSKKFTRLLSADEAEVEKLLKVCQKRMQKSLLDFLCLL